MGDCLHLVHSLMWAGSLMCVLASHVDGAATAHNIVVIISACWYPKSLAHTLCTTATAQALHGGGADSQQARTGADDDASTHASLGMRCCRVMLQASSASAALEATQTGEIMCVYCQFWGI